MIEKFRGMSIVSQAEMRVLIVEDDQFCQILISHQFKKLGVTVDLVVNGIDALEAFGQIPYRLIITDCHLPGIDGFETSRKIRSMEKTFNRNPVSIVAVTGDDLFENRDIYFSNGINEVFKKPLTDQMVREIIKKWFYNESSEVQIPVEMHHALSNIRKLKSDAHGDILLQLIDLYVKEVRSFNIWIDSACCDGEWVKIGQALHKLKSNCRTLGIFQAEKICSDLEVAVKNGDHDRVNFRLPQLKEHLSSSIEQVLYIKSQEMKKAG